MTYSRSCGGSSAGLVTCEMLVRTSCVLLGLCALLHNAGQAQSQVVNPSSLTTNAGRSRPTSVDLGADKLTDPGRILTAFTNSMADVVVNLAPPSGLATADFRSSSSLAKLRPEIKKRQQEVLDALPVGDVVPGHRFDNIAGFSARVSAAGLQPLQAHPQVVSIEPVLALEPHLAQGIALIHGMTYRSTYNGAGLAIAVCDTGID